MNTKDYRLGIEGAMGLEENYQDYSVCTLCSLHTTRISTPAGEGDQKSKIMVVAQAPGEKENLTGRMFVGPAGEILNSLFEVNGIKRADLYMTNLIKCHLPGSKHPSHEHIDNCSRYLDREIDLIKPEAIATLGYYATKYIYEKYSTDLLGKADIFNLVGKIYWISGKKILALQHPSALLYKDSIRGDMVRDYHKLKVLLEDCKYCPVCPIGKFRDRGLISEEWAELYCHGDWENCHRYKMEEKGIDVPDHVLPDGRYDSQIKNFLK
ncbi:MAG: uracil-DNA glycosylase [candidate division Zixibacteria bacterium HGW-Zixibacteria-1]|nr:MAG: uracil-DNA glycosylase [candidate division Zixibacteria bacterium HGW-Zixibacteria-1]